MNYLDESTKNDLIKISFEISTTTMTKKVQSIISFLKNNTNEMYTDGAFRLFIDNQINVEELTEILKAVDITLPSEFYNLSKGDQKRYRNNEQDIVYYTEKTSPFVEGQIVFNNPYFYDLVEHSRKSITFTNKLIEYTYQLVDTNLLFLGMQYIKIHNTYLRYNDVLMKYANHLNINDLYSLTMDLVNNLSIEEEIVEIKNFLLRELKKEGSQKNKLVGINLINDPTQKFFFLMEKLLSKLSRKEANTLKIKFLILDKTHLRANLDYYEDNKPAKQILKYYAKKSFSTRTIKDIKDHLKKYPDLLDGIKPNGYMALYYALLANEDE